MYFYLDNLTLGMRRPYIRTLASANVTRFMLNQYYNLLNDLAKSRFHARYAKIFRNHRTLDPGKWTVTFAGHKIIMPIRPLWSWLDWDMAVSILGHDIKVKQTYAALVRSDQRPALFLDVGANYGTHSMLFLSVGIPVIAFEPNPQCASNFQDMCKLNGVTGRWEQIAVGNINGEIELVYPEKDTWLGSVSSAVTQTFKKSSHVITHTVPLKRLDDYLNNIPRDKVLIKIDVEGFEREVIEGASQLLIDCKPKIIFESNDRDARWELFKLLTNVGYTVHLLPWRPVYGARTLDRDEFRMSAATNFIAINRVH